MFRNFIVILLVLISSSLKADQYSLRSFHPKMEETIKKIYSFPPTQRLLERVNANGPISIQFAGSNICPYDGLGDAHERHILVSDRLKSEGNVLSTIVFELHNAAGSEVLEGIWEEAKCNLISREDFVDKLERWEFNNVMGTQKMLNEGISKGFFPKSARMYYPTDYRQHRLNQEKSGHSQWFRDKYNQLRSR